MTNQARHHQYCHHDAGTRRRAAAQRLVGGDPESRDKSRLRRASTGLRASGFREGFARGELDACRALWPFLTSEGRTVAENIAAKTKAALS